MDTRPPDVILGMAAGTPSLGRPQPPRHVAPKVAELETVGERGSDGTKMNVPCALEPRTVAHRFHVAVGAYIGSLA